MNDPSTTAADAEPATERRPRVTWWLGLALCVLPASLLAACSLASDDDSASSPPATTAAADSNVTTEPTATDDTRPVDTGAVDDPAPSEAAPSEATPGEADPAPISFAADIEPIITSTCANCHTGNGPGTQHVRLDTAGIVARSSLGIDFVVQSHFMPPWPAGDDSVDFDHDWSLSDDEIALLSAWHEAGAPLDVPTDHVIAPLPGASARLDDPDISVRSRGSYDGELGQPDTYRCMVYDPAFDSSGFVTGMDFVPEQEQVVHHAVGFVLEAADRELVDGLDGVDGQGGWECFGFSPGPTARLIYAWAPGQSATRYDDGAGLLLDDGDFFVVQTHYHYDVEAPADQSRLDLDWVPIDEAEGLDPVDVQVLLAPAEIPCSADETGPLCDREAARQVAIDKYGPPGAFADFILAICGQSADDFAGFTEGVANASCDQTIGTSGEIHSIFGHQHELGSSFRLILHPDTPDEVVLLDIPVWDFDWQLNYEPAESIVLERGDVIRMECSWDRSLRDPALEPAYVLWADGTDDEMCFASLTTRPVR
ncbi:MAG: hypothetical protein ACE37B_05825 [Ilumatobacter sp.]|uniref:hypothetical protein n=1 Tax=Ilumatobacter sp. TaxID=1967498 RepID=UPI00391AD9A2